MKIFKSVIVLFIGVLLIPALLHIGNLTTTNYRLHTSLIGETSKLEKLTAHVANLERKYVDQKELRERTKRAFKQQTSSLKGRIKLLSNATYLIRERARKSNNSDLAYEGKGVKYIFNEIRFRDGPPIGYVLIFDDGRVVSKVYNHEIDVKMAVSRDEDSGRYNILSRADFVLRSGHRKPDGKNWYGVSYPLKIKGGTAYIDPTEPPPLKSRFFGWVPKYNLGVNIDSAGSAPGIGVSLMGYGYSKRDLSFKFLQMGVEYRKGQVIRFTLMPVLWRPFKNSFSNTYIGVGRKLDGETNNYFFGLSVGF